MASGSITPDAFQRIKSDMDRLTVTQLKSIARAEGLQVSGTKGLLQQRVKTRLDEYFRSNDTNGFQRVRNHISSTTRSSSGSTFSSLPSTSHPTHLDHNKGGGPSPGSTMNTPNNSYAQLRLNFKESPFYDVEQPLTRAEMTKAADSSRGNIELKIKLPPEVALRFTKDNPVREQSRIMVFCAAEPVSTFVKLDVSFPNQVELRVNGTEVRANLRGLKNRPGSTRPADITDLIRKSASYENSLVITYALTNKRYYFVVNLVKHNPAEDLVKRLEERRAITREQVVREMIEKAQDADLEATSTVMSLKCPLSTLRMTTPCRSTICIHNQCFDALSFLQLQQQAPTWTCPLCNRIVSFNDLQVDLYVDHILKAVPEAVEQVSISPDGEWTVLGQGESNVRHSNAREDQNDEGLIEIPDVSYEENSSRFTAAAASGVTRTPTHPSREPSISSGVARSSNGKRHHSAVIDLTISDDEEQEEPSRASKRLAIHPSPSVRQPFFNSSSKSLGSGDGHSNLIGFNMPKTNTSERQSPIEYCPARG